MGVRSIDNIVLDEQVFTPSDSEAVPDSYNMGFRVGSGGDVTFAYDKGGRQVGGEFTRAFNTGDEFFGRILYIKATGTTASGFTVFRLT